MKKLTILACIVFIIVINVFMLFSEENHDTFQTMLDNRPESINPPNAMIIPGYETVSVDDIIVYSHAVAVAKVEKIEEDSYDGIGYELKLAVDEVIWGECPYSELILFENLYGGHIKEGEEYLLFLRALNVYAYPENSYNIVGNGAYIIEDNTLYGTSKEADNWISDQNNTLDKMKDYLSKIPVAYTFKDNSVANSYDEISAMYEASDSVAKVKITSAYEENAIVDVIGIEIIENYKGSALSEEVKYLWPAEKNMTVEEEYFVFVDADGLPVAREGAIIGANDSNFNEAKEFLANK